MKDICLPFTQNQAVLQLEEYKQPYWLSTKQVLIMISLESKEINLIRIFKSIQITNGLLAKNCTCDL